MLTLFFIFLLFLQATTEPPKPSGIEREVTIIVISAVVGAFVKWVFDYTRQKSSDERDCAKLLLEVQDKLAVWVQRFQDVKREAILLEDLITDLKRVLKLCFDRLGDCEEARQQTKAVLDKVIVLLNGVVAYENLLEEIKELSEEIEKPLDIPTMPPITPK